MIGIVAVSVNGVIGIDNNLPWRIPQDLMHFRDTTTGHAVLMGRKTWESIPERFRPLPGRENFVLSGGKISKHTRDDVEPMWDHLDQMVAGWSERRLKVFCIGGARTYAICLPWITEWIVTSVDVAIKDPQAIYMPSDWLKGFTPQAPHYLIAEYPGKHPAAVINRWVRASG